MSLFRRSKDELAKSRDEAVYNSSIAGVTKILKENLAECEEEFVYLRDKIIRLKETIAKLER